MNNVVNPNNSASLQDFCDANLLTYMLTDDIPVFENGGQLTIMYHNNCMDGMVSAFIVERMFKKLFAAQDVAFIPMQYGWLTPAVPKDSYVIMVDFCMDPPLLDELASNCKGLTVIDHHIGALLKFVPGAWNNKYNVIFADERIENMAATNIMARMLQWFSFIDPQAVNMPGLVEMADVVGGYDSWQHDGRLHTRENYIKNYFSKFVLPIHDAECKYLGQDPKETPQNVSILVGHMLLNWNDAPFQFEDFDDPFNMALVKGMAAQSKINEEIAMLRPPLVEEIGEVTLVIHQDKVKSELVAPLSSPDNLKDNTLLVVKMTEHSKENPDAVWTVRWRGRDDSPLTARSLAMAFGGNGHTAAAGFRSELQTQDVLTKIRETVLLQLGL